MSSFFIGTVAWVTSPVFLGFFPSIVSALYVWFGLIPDMGNAGYVEEPLSRYVYEEPTPVDIVLQEHYSSQPSQVVGVLEQSEIAPVMTSLNSSSSSVQSGLPNPFSLRGSSQGQSFPLVIPMDEVDAIAPSDLGPDEGTLPTQRVHSVGPTRLISITDVQRFEEERLVESIRALRSASYPGNYPAHWSPSSSATLAFTRPEI